MGHPFFEYFLWNCSYQVLKQLTFKDLMLTKSQSDVYNTKMMFVEIIKVLKNRTYAVLKTIGVVQSSILLTVFYYLILGPFALVYKLSRSFSKQPANRQTFWIKRNDPKPTQELLQKQF